MKTTLNVRWFVGVAIIFAATFVTPRPAFADKKGQDYPDDKCQRNNTDKTTASGPCSSVCKDLTVSTTKDVNSGLKTCKQAATRVGAAGWGLVPVTGNSGVSFLRYNAQGDVQACALTAKADLECRPIAVRMVEAK
ncbi:MAG: hypothetical protein ACRD59_16025 [Candidatus Acidiferrales bacterium]